MDFVRFSLGVLCFLIAYDCYGNVQGKKPLTPGDNRFFIEDINVIPAAAYYNSWRLLIVLLLGGITFVFYSFDF
jgi:hypothetical protein